VAARQPIAKISACFLTSAEAPGIGARGSTRG
jgi:hypothetical protein